MDSFSYNIIQARVYWATLILKMRKEKRRGEECSWCLARHDLLKSKYRGRYLQQIEGRVIS